MSTAYDTAFWGKNGDDDQLLLVSTKSDFREHGLSIPPDMEAGGTVAIFNEFCREVRKRCQDSKWLYAFLNLKQRLHGDFIAQVSISKQLMFAAELRKQAKFTLGDKADPKKTEKMVEEMKNYSKKFSFPKLGKTYLKELVKNCDAGHSRINIMNKARKGLCLHYTTEGLAIERAKQYAPEHANYPYLVYEKRITPIAAKGILQRFVEYVHMEAKYENPNWKLRERTVLQDYNEPSSVKDEKTKEYFLNCTTMIYDLLYCAKVAERKYYLTIFNLQLVSKWDRAWSFGGAPAMLAVMLQSKLWKRNVKLYGNPPEKLPPDEPRRSLVKTCNMILDSRDREKKGTLLHGFEVEAQAKKKSDPETIEIL